MKGANLKAASAGKALVSSIIQAMAELQKHQIPRDLVGDLKTIDEQVWDLVDECEQREEDER